MKTSQAAALSVAILSSLLGVQLCAASPQPVQEASAPKAPAKAAVDLPDTPVGRQTKAYLAASGTGDPEKLTAFLKEHFPSAASNPQFVQLQQQTQGVDIQEIVEASDTRLVLAVKSRRSGTALTMILVVEAAAPHRFTTIGLRMGS